LQEINIVKVSFDDYDELVTAEPQVQCSEDELNLVLNDIYNAVTNGTYIFPFDDRNNLFDEYIFKPKDQDYILKDLSKENFVGKIKDLSKGSLKRKEKGYPDEYLFVFKYACKVFRKEDINKTSQEKIMIYIKINDRKNPNNVLIVVSFHRNRK